MLVLRWAYWLLQEGRTAFVLGFFLGRGLLGASRGKFVEPGVVHFACRDLRRELSFQCYDVDVACSWSSWSCPAYKLDQVCVELRIDLSEIYLSDGREVSKAMIFLNGMNTLMMAMRNAIISSMVLSVDVRYITLSFTHIDRYLRSNRVIKPSSLEIAVINLSHILREETPLYDDVNEMLIGSGPFVCDHTLGLEVSRSPTLTSSRYLDWTDE